ncbi:glutathione S-transferase family protein [Pseudovibrio sp. Tun.PSC04-5.I4]|uniref:glutathione S-transferase family protein n=1 Tax=Pseudovibrio sp. Tun.PSC04-5.I4 TaxID=1798213 RepID=UPI000886AC6B|nr:glutathione S-transferase family protein [Pseudovibrio sp. Tun.PSC04-5.I4]SDR34475.1 Glutathione S-transferase [Pseudovibrio sp. Tun.PSC04-5.I4]
MITLRTSPTSPYGRKARIAVAVLGIEDQVQLDWADTRATSGSLYDQNPLAKVPTVLLENGDVVYDSRVVLELLDQMAGGGVIIPKGDTRIAVLTKQAMADGIVDAAIQAQIETRNHPEEHWNNVWIERQLGKVNRCLKAFNDNPLPTPEQSNGIPDCAQIALACALGYLDLRANGDWRKDNPDLVKWHTAFIEQVPAYDATLAPEMLEKS